MEWFSEKYAGTQYFILDIRSGASDVPMASKPFRIEL